MLRGYDLSFAGPDVMSAAKLGRIHGLAATSERCRPVPAKLVSGFRAAAPDLRDSDHRTLPPAGELSRGSADRDVPGGDFGSAGRGHHRGPLGHAGKPKHGLEPQQEDLREDRGLAEPADRGEHPYLYLDGIVMKRSWAGEVPMSRSWWPARSTLKDFATSRHLRGRQGGQIRLVGVSATPGHCGLTGVQLIISDACRGLMESAAEYLPEARWQRCMVHFYRNVFSHVPATKVREVSHMLEAIHAQESRDAADRKARAIVDDLRAAKMNTAADLVERSVSETLTCRVGGGAQ